MGYSDEPTIISSDHKWYDLKLTEVWRYRDLVGLFTRRNFMIRYKQTILGPAWLIVNPLLSSLIYYVIFGRIAGLGTDGIPQIVFYMSGNALWTYFAGCVTKNSATFTDNAHIFGKVYFPRLTVPLSNVITSVFEFLIQLLMVALFAIPYLIRGELIINPIVPLGLLVSLLLLGIMGLGVGIVISSMTAKYRDLTVLVSFGIQLWMYVTPVVYPLSETSGWMRTALLCNPVTMPVELFRSMVFGVGLIHTGSLLWSIVFMTVVILLGVSFFNRTERTFMDTV